MKHKSLVVALMSIIIGTIQLVANNKDSNQSYNLIRALEEVNKGNKKGALEYFNKEVSENPRNGYAYMGLATFHFGNSKYGDARTAAESALKFLPKKDKISLSKVYTLRSELLLIERDTVSAYQDLATAIRLDSSNETAYEKRGQLYYEQQRYDEGDSDYKKILQLNPGGVMGQMGLGRNAHARKDYDKAINYYNHIIAFNPDYSSGYSFRAESFIEKGDYLKAIDDICKAIEIDSDEKACLLLSKFPADQFTLVVTKLKGLSAKHPHTGEYEYYTAKLYNDRRMFTESNAALEKAFETDARGFLLEMISDNYSEMGDYSNALKYIDRAIQMDPDDDSLIGKRADILMASGDVDGAISQLSEYIEKNPDFFGGYYRRGWFKDVSNKTDEAIEDYKMAIMLEPDYAYAHFGLADMLMRKGETDNAKQEYTKVLELDSVPNNESCAMYALLALGRQEEAKAFMDKVILNDSITPGNYYDAACLSARMGELDRSLSYLRKSFEKGYRRFHHVMADDDLEPIRQSEQFLNLMEEFKAKVSNDTLPSSETPSEIVTETTEIPFTPEGGCVSVKCSINDLPLSFIFDTGASTISISQLEANFMLKNGYLSSKDVVGSGKFVDANGDVSEGTVLNLREVNFGGLKLNNVRASVVRNQKAPLLLGQSVLGRLGSIEIDNQNKKLIIKTNK